MTIEVLALSVGQPKEYDYQGRTIRTAIFKEPVQGPVYLSKTLLEGDAQVNLKFHGGVEKAVHVFSYEHYPFFEQKLGVPLSLAAFGENLTSTGLLEENVCVGDIYSLGDAVVQVSLPRIPCMKINLRFGLPNVLKIVEETGYTGFYLRVLQEGLIDEARTMKLLEKHSAGLTIAALNHLLFHDKDNVEGMQRALEVAELADSFKNVFAERLQKRLG